MKIAAVLLSSFLHAAGAWAQAYPTKPVKVIVPFAPGGGSDIVARAVTTKLQDALGQPFVIENRGGAGGLVGTEAAARAPADGYTILIMSDSFPVLAATHKPAFDPMNSLVPVAQISIAPFGLMVHPSVPANTVAEFIALAKAKPESFSYGSSGSGGLTHLITEMFSQMAGIRMVHVPYKSTGAAMPDFLSGTITAYVGNVSALLPQVNAGKLKLLAVTNAERWPLLPNVPTIAETIPGFAADPWFGLFVPRGTPAAIIETLNAAVNKMAAEEELRKNFAGQGMLPRAGSPAAFGEVVRRDYARWVKVVQDIGFKPE
ncbi:MAG TPA: tripartite tricarboxylate transporter substrate binding protein [Usitatibacter sp.]|nr:tripartite tricarboxylate transporter substrate binding protein [Usitatibacter sp.]